MNIMGMGWEEMMIILIGALLIFGPDRLPEVAGQIGKFLRDIRKMTGDLTGELEKTAGVGDIKKAVQNELAGVKSTVDSATKSVQSTANSAASSVNKTVAGATSSVKGTTTAAKATTSTTASKSTTSSTTAKAATPPKPVASKKDPWADVSFFDDPAPSNGAAKSTGTTATSPATAAMTSTTVQAAKPVTPPVGVDQLDALGRARQRRATAGYNRRAS